MYTLLALLGLLPLSAVALPTGDGFMDVGSPEWLKRLQDGMFLKKDEPFCKANVAVIKALLKEPGGTNYCSNVLNIPATTHTATVYFTPTALSAGPGLLPAMTGPAPAVEPAVTTKAADPAATSPLGDPTTSSSVADPTTISSPAVTSSAPETLITSTKTMMQTVNVDVTVTVPIVQTETTTTTVTSQNLLTCLSTAIKAKVQASAGPIVGGGQGSGAGAGVSAGLDIPPIPTGFPFGFGKRASDPKYGLKPVCLPDIWSEKEIQQACECLALPPSACTTTVTAVNIPRPTAAPQLPVAGVAGVAGAAGLSAKSGGKGGSGGLGGLTGGLGGVGGVLGGILRRINGDDERCATVTSTMMASRTVTVTTVSTATKVETAYATSTSIVPNGLAYKNFTHPFVATDPANNKFTSSFFKKRTPIAQGTLNGLSFSTPDWPSTDDFSATGNGILSIPGLAGEIETTLDTAFMIQAFFIATLSGEYTFASPGDNIDNWGMLWLGEPAYCDWDDANAAFFASRTSSAPPVSGTTTLTLTEGDAVPLTWLWGNGGGAARSYLSIRLPDGTVVDDGDMSAYFVRACNDGVFI
ncbi:hypothetical protein PG987_002091 [Apiospora arundinis]